MTVALKKLLLETLEKDSRKTPKELLEILHKDHGMISLKISSLLDALTKAMHEDLAKVTPGLNTWTCTEFYINTKNTEVCEV